jgi:hypothetical protein
MLSIATIREALSRDEGVVRLFVQDIVERHLVNIRVDDPDNTLGAIDEAIGQLDELASPLNYACYLVFEGGDVPDAMRHNILVMIRLLAPLTADRAYATNFVGNLEMPDDIVEALLVGYELSLATHGDALVEAIVAGADRFDRLLAHSSADASQVLHYFLSTWGQNILWPLPPPFFDQILMRHDILLDDGFGTLVTKMISNAFFIGYAHREEGVLHVENRGLGSSHAGAAPSDFPILISIAANRFPGSITFAALNEYISEFVNKCILKLLRMDYENFNADGRRFEFDERILMSVEQTLDIMLHLLLDRRHPAEGDETPSVSLLEDARRAIEEFPTTIPDGVGDDVRQAALSRAQSLAVYMDEHVIHILEYLRGMSFGYYTLQGSVQDFGVPVPSDGDGDDVAARRRAALRGPQNRDMSRLLRELLGDVWVPRFRIQATPHVGHGPRPRELPHR